MVLKGHHMAPTTPQPSRSQDLPSWPAVLHREVNGSPMPLPRRAPPLPPVKVTQTPAVQPATAVSYSPTSPFSPTTPYPPIPPRVGNTPLILNQGYPSMYMQQYPPPVPQRPPPRMAHQPGFIMQWAWDIKVCGWETKYTLDIHSSRLLVLQAACYKILCAKMGVLSCVKWTRLFCSQCGIYNRIFNLHFRLLLYLISHGWLWSRTVSVPPSSAALDQVKIFYVSLGCSHTWWKHQSSRTGLQLGQLDRYEEPRFDVLDSVCVVKIMLICQFNHSSDISYLKKLL